MRPALFFFDFSCHKCRWTQWSKRMKANPSNQLAQLLINKHWATLGVELVLVVAGILIALAIDGWADDREDRKSEQVYLELLVRDLGQIESQLKEQIDFEANVAKTCREVYSLISGDNPAAESKRIGEMLSFLSVRRTLFLESAAYADLTSTGSLGLIQDRTLRDQIIQYFADLRRRALIVEKNNRVFVDEGFKPFLMNSGVSNRPMMDLATVGLDVATAIQREFSAQMLNPVDEVLLLPVEAPQWAAFKQQLTWRAMVAVVDGEQVKHTLEITAQLGEALQAHLGN
jgi:hypothetical protein